MSPIKSILVPVDFSETSNHALDYAIDLASQLGARVTVMHAYELPIYGFPDGALVAGAEAATRISGVAQAALDEAVAKRQGRGVPLTSELRMGPPAEEVHSTAAELHADLIVVGTHGRKGLARALLGSVAESVIRTATRPVVAVHAPESE